MRDVKRLYFIILVLVLIISVSACSDNNFFVKDNATDIKIGIENFLNRGIPKEFEINIKNSCTIDNIKIVSYTIPNGYYGYAIMEKAKNETYKIINASWTTNIIELPVIKTNEGKYLLVVGRKYVQNIGFVKTEINNQKYVFDVAGESYFIHYYQVPKDTNIDYARFTFYDERNNKITNEVKAEY